MICHTTSGYLNEADGLVIDELGFFKVSLGWDGIERVLPSHVLSNGKWVRLVVNVLDLEKIMALPLSLLSLKILQNWFEQHLVH